MAAGVQLLATTGKQRAAGSCSASFLLFMQSRMPAPGTGLPTLGWVFLPKGIQSKYSSQTCAEAKVVLGSIRLSVSTITEVAIKF